MAQALAKMDGKVAFVGITDLSAASLCPLQWRAMGAVPSDCRCGHLPTRDQPHARHEVPPHAIANATADVRLITVGLAQ